MVNWKANESTDRLIAVLIAAHPGLKVSTSSPPHKLQAHSPQLEYQAMATLFGQGATYDAIEGRFRRYRKMADEVKAEALSKGITELPRGRNGTTGSSSGTPRTPRGPRGGITKPSSSSGTGRSRKSTVSQVLSTPTKRGRGGGSGNNNNNGMSFMEAIFLDDALSEEDTKMKSEAAEILTGLVGNSAVVHDLTGASTPTASSASIASMKMEDGAESFSSAFGGAVKQEGGNIEVPAIENDDFDMAGLYFHGHGGYDMDDIYGGAA
ncbi:hypothetical protein CDV55_104374 [Aspergillus turcosus]|nr:hypothetical protein CDV55_104374 [Aspergillus turcosus]